MAPHMLRPYSASSTVPIAPDPPIAPVLLPAAIQVNDGAPIRPHCHHTGSLDAPSPPRSTLDSTHARVTQTKRGRNPRVQLVSHSPESPTTALRKTVPTTPHLTSLYPRRTTARTRSGPDTEDDLDMQKRIAELPDCMLRITPPHFAPSSEFIGGCDDLVDSVPHRS